jgi:hypothetical protein
MGTFLACCPLALAEQKAPLIPGDRWLEIDLYWFADFSRYVQLNFPASWKPVSASDVWHDKTESELRNDWRIELGQAQCELYKADQSGNHN